MFYSLEGRIAHQTPGVAVVDCGGVGYLCHTSMNTQAKLESGKAAKLYTYLNVREDTFDLYGFATTEELDCFKKLIEVSGVGPKAALAVLSTSSPERLAAGIAIGDEKLLTVAPGVGKKLAQRILLELKDKLGASAYAGGDAGIVLSESDRTVTGEAILALTELGYPRAQAAAAVNKIAPAGLTVEEIIMAAMKSM